MVAISGKIWKAIEGAAPAAAATGIATLPAQESEAMFIGKAAKKGWDEAAIQLAKRMEAEGAGPDEIWAATGELGSPMYRGPDGEWRQEISDVEATYDPYEYHTGAEMEHLPGGFSETGELRAMQKHPELQEAYPSLEQTVLTTGRGGPDSSASYTSPGKPGDPEVIDISPGLLRRDEPGRQQLKRGVLHEEQHGIQEREGWAPGSSPEHWHVRSQQLTKDWDYWKAEVNKARDEVKRLKDSGVDADSVALKNAQYDLETSAHVFLDVDKEMDWYLTTAKTPEGAYMREAGEFEARTTEDRANMTLEQRIALPPWEMHRQQRMLNMAEGKDPKLIEKYFPGESQLHVGEPRTKIFEGQELQAKTWQEKLDELRKKDSDTTTARSDDFPTRESLERGNRFDSTSPRPRASKSVNERFDEIMEEINYRVIAPFAEPGEQMVEGASRLMLDALLGVASGVVGIAGYSINEDDPLVQLGVVEGDPEKRGENIEAIRERLRGQGAQAFPMDDNAYAEALSSGITTLVEKIAPTLSEAQRRILQSKAYRQLAPYIIKGWESIPEQERKVLGGVGEMLGSVI